MKSLMVRGTDKLWPTPIWDSVGFQGQSHLVHHRGRLGSLPTWSLWFDSSLCWLNAHTLEWEFQSHLFSFYCKHFKVEHADAHLRDFCMRVVVDSDKVKHNVGIRCAVSLRDSGPDCCGGIQSHTLYTQQNSHSRWFGAGRIRLCCRCKALLD